jgi:hypothetical protein
MAPRVKLAGLSALLRAALVVARELLGVEARERAERQIGPDRAGHMGHGESVAATRFRRLGLPEGSDSGNQADSTSSRPSTSIGERGESAMPFALS